MNVIRACSTRARSGSFSASVSVAVVSFEAFVGGNDRGD